MPKKFIAASLVTICVAFFVLEFFGVFGLIGSSRPDMAASVEAALASLTPAEISDNKFTAESDSLLIASDPPVVEPVFLEYPPKVARFVKSSFPIYKLHVAFLL